MLSRVGLPPQFPAGGESFALLERVAGLGLGRAYVAAQREALVLARALVPQGFEGFLAQLEHDLADPAYVELTRRGLAAESWAPDDPRIEELATAMAEYHLARQDGEANLQSWHGASTQYQLINHHRKDQAPVAARLTELTEAKLRGAGAPTPRG